MKKNNTLYVGKYIFWVAKKYQGISWSVGYVFEQEGEMIRIGNDNSVCGDLYHSNWYEIKDLKIKIRKAFPHAE